MNQWFKKVKVLYQDPWSKWLVNIAILLIIGTWSMFFWKPIVPSELAPLHYNIYVGIDLIGFWHWLFVLPGVLVILSLLNFYLAVQFFTKKIEWAYWLLLTIVFTNAIMFIYLYNILNFNRHA